MPGDGAADRAGEQSPDLADGQRDEAGLGGRRGVRAGGRRGRGAGAVTESRGGDCADREGGHNQHDVPQYRGLEPGLALVQAEAALSQLEALLHWPAQPCRPESGLRIQPPRHNSSGPLSEAAVAGTGYPLAAELGYSLVTKDMLKEKLHDALYERERLLSLGGCPVEVHCTCPLDIAVARYSTRPRHPVHVTAAHRQEAELAQFNEPVGIGSLITVDTTKQADVPAVASQVRRLHARAPEACANTAGIHAAGAIAGGKAIG